MWRFASTRYIRCSCQPTKAARCYPLEGFRTIVVVVGDWVSPDTAASQALFQVVAIQQDRFFELVILPKSDFDKKNDFLQTGCMTNSRVTERCP